MPVIRAEYILLSKPPEAFSSLWMERNVSVNHVGGALPNRAMGTKDHHSPPPTPPVPAKSQTKHALYIKLLGMQKFRFI